MNPLSLSELTSLIKDTINIEFSNYYFVVGEINQFSVNYSGHAYLQLVEKEEKGNKAIATMRAIIWANKYNMIQAYFESVTGSELSSGIKILAKVEVTFHQVYGMSLVIHDIDPTYTLGDIEKKRQEIIDQLQSDGIFEMNKTLDFPLVPQRIAIISSKTAAGFGDFLEHLTKNERNYSFKYQLFNAVMQGDKTEKSIIKALDKIFEKIDNFDVVIIIRGGGSKLDLSAFDSYDIAVNIAQFPLPILTGIGHQRDLSIADLVSFKSLKTPTAVADYIVIKTTEFEDNIIDKYELITNYITEKIEIEKYNLEKSYNYIETKITSIIQENKSNLEFLKQDLKHQTNQYIFKKNESLKSNKNQVKTLITRLLERKTTENLTLQNKLNNNTKTFLSNNINMLNIIEAKLEAHNPQHILNLGFSITTKNGKLIKSENQVKKGDNIETQLKEGVIKSKIN